MNERPIHETPNLAGTVEELYAISTLVPSGLMNKPKSKLFFSSHCEINPWRALNLAGRTQTAPLYIFAKFNEGQIEAANAIAIVLALLSFVIFSVLFFARDWLEFETQEA